MTLWTMAVARLAGFVMIGLAVSAVIVARVAPARSEQDAPDIREQETWRPNPPRYATISDQPLYCAGPGLRLLNNETGRIEAFPLVGRESFDEGACSPWIDQRGRTHVAARWTSRDHRTGIRWGLGRVALPGGEVLDLVETNLLIVGAPCWYPDRPDTVLFAAKDGRLYAFTFTGRRRSAASSQDGAQPVPLMWRCSPPWKGPFALESPCWLAGPSLRGYLVVSIRCVDWESKAPAVARSQLWWLRLGPGGTTIDAVGRLIVARSEGPPPPTEDQMLSTVSTTPDGGLALAYLAGSTGTDDVRLCLARMTVDPRTGAPSVEPSDIVELAGNRARHPVAFSADGRWLFAFSARDRRPSEAGRFSVVDALATGPRADALIHIAARRSDSAARPSTRDNIQR